jgi:hypothetical protein
MIGDTNDFIARLKRVLPDGWFSDSTPVLDTILRALSTAWATLYSLLAYTRRQARISSATGFWLDLIARDYLGSTLLRSIGESDTSFVSRIKVELIRERTTRSALNERLRDLTGTAPRIFEPANCNDTGAYGAGAGGGLAYVVAGGWGSLALPFTAFITITIPPLSAASSSAGWNSDPGAYNVGQLGYSSASAATRQLGTEDVSAAITSVLPLAATAWVNITDAP